MVCAYMLMAVPDRNSKFVEIGDGPYSILGDFAIYLRDGIKKDEIQKDELDRAFNFLNEMGASDDIEVQNQLVVGVLEIMADTDESVSVAKQNLKGKALELFERTLSGWNNV